MIARWILRRVLSSPTSTLGFRNLQAQPTHQSDVVPRMKNIDISWIAYELPDMDVIVFVADDPKAPRHSPKNKGHKVMIYLNLHRRPMTCLISSSSHHNHLLGHDAVETVHRLCSDYVIREGYVNMRCEWTPGCPEWLHPDNTREDLDKQWRRCYPAAGRSCSHPIPPQEL